MTLIGPLLTLLVCAAAIWKGGAPERADGVVILVAQAVALLASTLSIPQPWPVIAADLVVGVGLCGLLLRQPRPWLYVQLSLLSSLLLVHAYMLQEGAEATLAYDALVDGLNLIALSVLALATALSAPVKTAAYRPRT